MATQKNCKTVSMPNSKHYTVVETSESAAVRHKKFVEKFDRLVNAVKPVVVQVAVKTFSKHLISDDNICDASNRSISAYQRANDLLQVIMSRIKDSDAHFDTFVGILQDVSLTDLAYELKRAVDPTIEFPAITGDSQSDSGSASGTESVDATGFKCPCGQCSLEKYFRDRTKCPGLQKTSFPHLDTSHLSRDERKSLEHQLIADTNRIKKDFKKFSDAVFKALERNETHVSKIRSTVFSSAKAGSSKTIQKLHCDKLESIITIFDLKSFLICYDYVSFINYGILEALIDEYDECKECQTVLDSYLQKFKDFSRRNVFEVPSDIFTSSSTPDNLLVVKVIDETWFGAKRDTPDCPFTMWDITSIQNKIAEVIGTGHDHGFIDLIDVGKGCLQLAFEVLSCQEAPISPLTTSQLSELIRCGIIVLYQPNLPSLPTNIQDTDCQTHDIQSTDADDGESPPTIPSTDADDTETPPTIPSTDADDTETPPIPSATPPTIPSADADDSETPPIPSTDDSETPHTIPSTDDSETPPTIPSADADDSETPPTIPSADESETPPTIPSADDSETPPTIPSADDSETPPTIPSADDSVTPPTIPSADDSVTPPTIPSTDDSVTPPTIPSTDDSVTPVTTFMSSADSGYSGSRESSGTIYEELQEQIMDRQGLSLRMEELERRIARRKRDIEFYKYHKAVWQQEQREAEERVRGLQLRLAQTTDEDDQRELESKIHDGEVKIKRCKERVQQCEERINRHGSDLLSLHETKDKEFKRLLGEGRTSPSLQTDTLHVESSRKVPLTKPSRRRMTPPSYQPVTVAAVKPTVPSSVKPIPSVTRTLPSHFTDDDSRYMTSADSGYSGSIASSSEVLQEPRKWNMSTGLSLRMVPLERRIAEKKSRIEYYKEEQAFWQQEQRKSEKRVRDLQSRLAQTTDEDDQRELKRKIHDGEIEIKWWKDEEQYWEKKINEAEVELLALTETKVKESKRLFDPGMTMTSPSLQTDTSRLKSSQELPFKHGTKPSRRPRTSPSYQPVTVAAVKPTVPLSVKPIPSVTRTLPSHFTDDDSRYMTSADSGYSGSIASSSEVLQEPRKWNMSTGLSLRMVPLERRIAEKKSRIEYYKEEQAFWQQEQRKSEKRVRVLQSRLAQTTDEDDQRELKRKIHHEEIEIKWWKDEEQYWEKKINEAEVELLALTETKVKESKIPFDLRMTFPSLQTDTSRLKSSQELPLKHWTKPSRRRMTRPSNQPVTAAAVKPTVPSSEHSQHQTSIKLPPTLETKVDTVTLEDDV